MKVLIPIVISLLMVGCGKGENGAHRNLHNQSDTNESTFKSTDQNTTKASPKELTLEERKVVGTYEAKIGENSIKFIFLESGVVNSYVNGRKTYIDGDEEKALWSISQESELHFIVHQVGMIYVYKINPDGNLNGLAYIQNGKRIDYPKDKITTFKKIK